MRRATTRLAGVRAQARRIDRGLLQRSAHSGTPGLDRALVAVTRAASYSRLWLLIAGGLAATGGERRRAAGRGLLAIAIAAPLANGPGKLLVRRRRPLPLRRAPLLATPRSSSFPSGHSAAALAFATATSAELPLLGPALLPLAAVVAYSRVHTGVHYPSDVLAGAAIGVCSGLLAVRLPLGRHGGSELE